MSDPAIRAFNVNGYVRVKFSAASLRLWRERAHEMRQAVPAMAYLFPDEPPTDADGFYRGQLWSIMHLVGPECIAGGRAFEDGCLHLEFEEVAQNQRCTKADDSCPSRERSDADQ